MDYQEALNYLHDLCKFGINLGLDRIKLLLNFLHNPQERIKTIHVAGTNGKGSTSAIIASILQQAGLTVGLYTSPHLKSYKERIKINDSLITEKEFAFEMEIIKSCVEKVVKKIGAQPTEFEVLTAVALNYFAKKNVEIAVIETGLGGRIDSTNVIIPEVSIISNIGYDHISYLGSSLKEIAKEKAGIIKKEIPVVIACQKEEAKEVILATAKNNNAFVVRVDEFSISQKDYNSQGQWFNLKTENNIYENLFLPLLGDHQMENTANAVGCIELLKEKGWQISQQDIKNGIKNVKWPARLEYINYKPQLLLDGAHNSQGIAALSAALLKYFSYERLIIVLGILSDKEKEKMLHFLIPLSDEFIVTRPPNSRAGNWRDIAALLRKKGKNVSLVENPLRAVDEALIKAGDKDLICFTGSLYLIGEIREYVLNASSST